MTTIAESTIAKFGGYSDCTENGGLTTISYEGCENRIVYTSKVAFGDIDAIKNIKAYTDADMNSMLANNDKTGVIVCEDCSVAFIFRSSVKNKLMMMDAYDAISNVMDSEDLNDEDYDRIIADLMDGITVWVKEDAK